MINVSNSMEELKEIKAQLDQIQRVAELSAKRVLNVHDVCVLTGLSQRTIYNMTRSSEIPHYKPNQRLIYFDRADVEKWMMRNRVNANYEAEAKAIAYVVKNSSRKGGRA